MRFSLGRLRQPMLRPFKLPKRLQIGIGEVAQPGLSLYWVSRLRTKTALLELVRQILIGCVLVQAVLFVQLGDHGFHGFGTKKD